jgi:phospholipase/lecithinase/hemolysin
MCGVPVNQYFWLNSLHPTFPVHDVLAEKVAQMLK